MHRVFCIGSRPQTRVPYKRVKGCLNSNQIFMWRLFVFICKTYVLRAKQHEIYFDWQMKNAFDFYINMCVNSWCVCVPLANGEFKWLQMTSYIQFTSYALSFVAKLLTNFRNTDEYCLCVCIYNQTRNWNCYSRDASRKAISSVDRFKLKCYTEWIL